jgi:superoxide reductase
MNSKGFDRRDFVKNLCAVSGGSALAVALPGIVALTPGKAYGKTNDGNAPKGWSSNPDLIHKPHDPNNMTEFEKLHVPVLKMPIIAEDGSVIPFYVSSDHPMEKDHYIESVEILNFRDPIVHKGMIMFTPATGTVYFSSQIRAVSGSNKIYAIMKCNKHGRFLGEATVKVTVGGC